MQRTYEIMFIVRPDLTEEDNDKIISSLETQANSAGASVKHVERMGKRRLAYAVRGFQDGLYVLLTVEGSGNAVHEIERRMRVTEQVIKFITVRMDEEQKRLDKMKKLRDAKRKTSSAPAPPADAPSAAAEPNAPAPATAQ
jgi:small subunit ribosomal protein S6